MIGKVPAELLEELVIGRTGAADDAVLQGPAYGEDTAAIDLGEETLVVNTDPISLAVDRIGTLGVAITCNDIAASGARPRWLSSALFLPEDDDGLLDRITGQLDEAAKRQGVAIVGGHTEYAPALSTPLLVVTCFGLTERYVPSGGAEPGDRVILTKSAAVEATAILATDFRDRLYETIPEAMLDRAAGFYDEISVLAEANALASDATAMHDPTEGGIVTGLYELAAASNVGLSVDPDAISIREETARLCEAVGIDPLRTFGSGALVATLPESALEETLATLDAEGIEAAEIGEVVEAPEPELRLGDELIREPPRDEMYALWE